MEGDWGDKGGCRCQLFDDQALKPLLAELRNDFRKVVQEVEMHEKFCQTYDIYIYMIIYDMNPKLEIF